jgi:hypothetical protein
MLTIAFGIALGLFLFFFVLPWLQEYFLEVLLVGAGIIALFVLGIAVLMASVASR